MATLLAPASHCMWPQRDLLVISGPARRVPIFQIARRSALMDLNRLQMKMASCAYRRSAEKLRRLIDCVVC